MRKFLFIITVLTVAFIAGCSEKTDTSKSVKKENTEVKTETTNESNLNKEYLNKELLKASEEGDTEEIKKLFNVGADPNTINIYGQTALMLACPEANYEIVKILLSTGVNVNAKDKDGNTALMFIMPYGYYETNYSKKIMELLISYGADVNATNNSGNTALMRIVSDFTDGEMGERDRIELIDTMLAAGADVNIANRDGKTALMLIIIDPYNDYGKIATKLLAAGADINVMDNKGRTVLMDFVDKVDEKKAACADKDIGGIECDVPYPKTSKIMDYLNTLLSAGADINAKDKNAKTALTLAKEKGNEEIVKLLKAAGAKE